MYKYLLLIPLIGFPCGQSNSQYISISRIETLEKGDGDLIIAHVPEIQQKYFLFTPCRLIVHGTPLVCPSELAVSPDPACAPCACGRLRLARGRARPAIVDGWDA